MKRDEIGDVSQLNELDGCRRAPMHLRGNDLRVSSVIDETAAVAVAEPYLSMPGSLPGRIIGVDLARALAILGMFAAHIGPEPDIGGVVGAAMYVSHGRSSILFATLAGLSLALVTGGARTNGERVPGRAKRRIAVRAGIIFAIGTGLTIWGTPVWVILAYYGVLFLIALPFLRLRPSTNLVIAAVLAVLTPAASLMLLDCTAVAGVFQAIERFDPIAGAGGNGLVELLVTGGFPVLTWMQFVIAGVALGRLDWQRPRVRLEVAAAGIGVAVLAYGIAWVLGKTVDGAGVWVDEPARRTGNYWADLQWVSLLGAEAYTGTPFEILGGVGVAMVVLAGCMFAARFRRVVAPLGAMGSMSLTLYVGHVIAMIALDMNGDEKVHAHPLLPDESMLSLALFIVVAAASAWIWRRFFRRGPLEAGIHWVTALVK
jgi:Protein of unknown function (DUF418)/Heparan-alpha-glucosaminide N-acetyltransferase, catalytic